MMLSDNVIRLRALEPEDVSFLFEIENDPDLWFYSDRIAPLSRQQLADYALSYDADPIRAGQIRLIAETVDEGEACAIVDLYDIDVRNSRAFVGIVTAPSRRRKGLSLRALHLLADYSRSFLQLQELAAKIPSVNTASARLFAKAGYVCEATLNDWLNQDGHLCDLSIYRLLLRP